MKLDFHDKYDIDGIRVIRPDVFSLWRQHAENVNQHQSLISDPGELLTDATAVIVMVKAYQPFHYPAQNTHVRIHPYYLVSNALYHVSMEMIEQIKRWGYQAIAGSQIPLRHAAIRADIGRIGFNGLLYHPQYGSRFAIQAIITNMPLDITHHNIRFDKLECGECRRCCNACPTSAITDHGVIDRHRCIREHMPINIETPNEIKTVIGSNYLGCDICQNVCPMNRHITECELPDTLYNATSMESLLNDATFNQQRSILTNHIGKNYTRKMRLLHSIIIHAALTGQHEYIQIIEQLRAIYPDIKMQNTINWAIDRIKAEQ